MKPKLVQALPLKSLIRDALNDIRNLKTTNCSIISKPDETTAPKSVEKNNPTHFYDLDLDQELLDAIQSGHLT